MRKPRTFYRIDAWEPDGDFVGAWLRLSSGEWMEVVAMVSIKRRW